MSIRITCIRKDNGDHYDPHEAITSLKWINDKDGNTGESTRLEMVAWVETGGYAYVKDASGNAAQLVVRTSPQNNKYVKTIADGRETNNLLALPECSV